MKNVLRLLLIIFLAFTFNGFSQMPGDNDMTFNPGDPGYGNGDGFNDAVYRAVIQSDGKIVVGGHFTTYNGISSNHIIRLNIDGTRDTTFHIGTGADNDVLAVAIQSDGKIIIAGYFLNYNGTSVGRIARLNPNGSIDPTFNTMGGASDIIRSLLIQPDGKIIVAGEFTFIAGTAINRIARLNTNGTIDNTFNPWSGANNTVYTLALQPDGKIFAGGQFSIFNGSGVNGIVRLNTNGSIDATFNIGTGTSGAVNASALQSDGKLIIGGVFVSYNGTTVNRITRLNTNGSIDATFNSGTGANSGVYEITTQSNGKILVGGLFTTYNGATSVRIMRLDASGNIDPTFNTGIGATNTVSSFAFQSDGKIVVGGHLTAYNNVSRPYCMRLDTNGVLDRSFNIATGVTGVVCSISLQLDGKIIMGGLFEAYNNRYLYRVARANADGSTDTTFNVGSGANNTVYATAVQSDGKILVGGSFTTFNGVPKNCLARLNSDGSMDPTFITGTGPNLAVRDIAIQPDGKILIVGGFTNYNGTNANSIVRLDANGGLDATFNIGTGANLSVFETGIQSDGKIIIAGDFTTFSGQSRVRLARLNINGTIDPTFTVAGGVDNIVETFAIQSDDKIVIAGYFGSYNGVSRNRIARINTNGTLDVTFNPGIGASNYIDGIAIQIDGKILIGGSFMAYNSVGRNRIARILVDCGTPVVTNVTPTTNLSICANTSTSLYASGSGTISWFASPSSTLSIATGSVYNTPYLNPGSYTYYAEAQTSCTVSNVRESITVTVSPNPTVTVNSGTICAGDSFTIIPNGANTYSYSGSSDVVSPTANATFTVIGTGLNGCENTAISSVTVNTLPAVLAITNNTLLCTGQTATLTSSGAASYTWSTNETTVDIVVSPTTTTNYSVIGVDGNGCSNTYTFSQDVDLCTGVIQSIVFEGLKIYPNPTSGLFTVDLPSIAEIFITNLLGEIILNENLISGKHYLDIQNQPAGVYFVKVVSKNEEQTNKIIKQ